tara:strand:+ start:242 stop:877 length:636 start_codon:yes stop_codon:yes gene_type:complete
MAINLPIIKGIYAITPDQKNSEILLRQVKDCCEGGINILQYRSKSLPWKKRLDQAREIKKVTDEYKIPLIINDDIDICLHLDTFGIHLGKDDESIKNARLALGADKCIGMSCYNQLDRVEMAIKNKADYIALGACFETKTKPTAPIVSLEMIKKVRQKYDIPTVAIGGITIDNINNLKETGIQCFALINSIFSSTDIISTIKQFKSKIQYE